MDSTLHHEVSSRPESVFPTYYREPFGLVTDTNADAVRERRKVNEQELRSELRLTYGLPCAERMQLIRQRLLDGIPDVHGYAITATRTEPAFAGRFRFLEWQEIPAASESYFQLIDKAYQQVQTEVTTAYQEQFTNYLPHTQEMVFRLAGVLYSLGILMHRYPDANGQTLRLLVESYISELIGDQGQIVFEDRQVETGKGNLQSGISAEVISYYYNIFRDYHNLRNPTYRHYTYLTQLIMEMPTDLSDDVANNLDQEYVTKRTAELQQLANRLELLLKDSSIWQDIRQVLGGQITAQTTHQQIRSLRFLLTEHQQFLAQRLDRQNQYAAQVNQDFDQKLKHFFNYAFSDVGEENILGFIMYEEFNRIGSWTPETQIRLEASVSAITTQLQRRWQPAAGA